MQFSLVALFAAVTVAAVPHMAGRNVPDSCDKQLTQCGTLTQYDAAQCTKFHDTCLGNCNNGFNSCNDAPAITDKDKCFSVFEGCAGHRREGDPRPLSS